jgi:imidazolonepropionase-like amidohydrolase
MNASANSLYFRCAGGGRPGARFDLSGPRLYTAGTLLTGVGTEAIRPGGVLVRGTSIIAAGAIPALLATDHSRSAELVDLGAGATIMPGLVDSHVHLGLDGGPRPAERMQGESEAEQVVLMLRNAVSLLAAGVTTARDLGAKSFLDITVRDAVSRGDAPGPRLVVAGRPLTPKGGHCWFMGGECESPQDLREMIHQHHEMGTDLIKVMSTGGFITSGSAPWSANFSAGELAMVVKEASSLGMRVAAHAHGREGISRAVTAGVATLEHCSFTGRDGMVGSDFDPALADKIAAAEIYVCPTTNIHSLLPERAEGVARVIAELHQRGVRIIAGTDAGVDNCAHGEYQIGLEALAKAGLPASEVLAAATARAARALGVDDRTGSITPGRDADLIAVDGDPLADISALRRLILVVARGAEHVRVARSAWPGRPRVTY